MIKVDFRLFVLLTIVGAFSINYYLDSKENLLIRQYGNLRPVVIANKDIAKSETILSSSVTMRAIPEAYVEVGAIGNIERALGTKSLGVFIKGEQITKHRLSRD